MRVLNLYTTLGCHLCDQAFVQVKSVLTKEQAANLNLVSVEISDSDTLMENYGIRIPVFKFQDEIKELAWPFTDKELNTFLTIANSEKNS